MEEGRGFFKQNHIYGAGKWAFISSRGLLAWGPWRFHALV